MHAIFEGTLEYFADKHANNYIVGKNAIDYFVGENFTDYFEMLLSDMKSSILNFFVSI